MPIKRVIAVAFMFLFLLSVTARDKTPSKESIPLNAENKTATEVTAQTNAEVYQLLDFDDEQEAEFTGHGLAFAPGSLVIQTENGMTAWSQDAYGFVRRSGDASTSTNSSLWCNIQYNARHDLFEITDGIYQVRGYNTSDVTSVRSEDGWIIMDCDSGRYTASEALKLFREQMGDNRVVAIVINHARVDHYGGVGGPIGTEDMVDVPLLLDEQIASGKTTIIVPQGFADVVMKENVLAGTATKRRAIYQYGSFLPYCEQGRLSVGISLTVVQDGTGYLAPTYEVTDTLFKTEADGVKTVLQLASGTESPTEINTYFPDEQTLWTAENCTDAMHNLYALRGVETHDANDWARYITQTQTLFSDAEVMFQSHNWPHWGADVMQEYLTNIAAVYEFIRDQTLLYINQDYTATEIAVTIELPEASDKVWYTRQYYSTLRHNVRAAYRKYMGWYGANPVHLNELESNEYAKKLIEYSGDPEEMLEQARAGYGKGEYQWVAQVTDTLIFANSGSMDARYFCTDALGQLGCQTESGAWRNAYLTAAYELRSDTDSYPQVSSTGAGTTAQDMDTQTILDYIGIMFDTEKPTNTSFTIRLKLTDGEGYLLKLHHDVLLYYRDDGMAEANLTLSTVRTNILAIADSDQGNIARPVTTESGDMALFENLCTGMTTPKLYFNIIEP